MQLIYSRHVSLGLLPYDLWRLEWRRGWGAMYWRGQCGPIALSLWRGSSYTRWRQRPFQPGQ